MGAQVRLRVHDGDADAQLAVVAAFCDQLFPALPADYVRSRRTLLVDPMLILAESGGAAVGFKMAYRSAPLILFSWLGGVLPGARERGIGAALMRRQHELARDAGYAFVETRTRTSNNPMIVLNLRSGFEISGIEADAYGRLVVIQRKALATDSAAA